MVENPFDFVVMNFISGMAAIFTLTNIYRRGKLFYTSFFVIISYSLLFTAITLLRDGNTEGLFLSVYLLFVGNGFLVLISYPLIFMFEQKFLFLSDTTLLELADTNLCRS
jgi:membrane-associated HD superfamily phosphohydrolase